jgi:hypothetical protein
MIARLHQNVKLFCSLYHHFLRFKYLIVRDISYRAIGTISSSRSSLKAIFVVRFGAGRRGKRCRRVKGRV